MTKLQKASTKAQHRTSARKPPARTISTANEVGHSGVPGSRRSSSIGCSDRQAWEGVLPNYVRRLTRLGFLAPRIVEAIAAGHQPSELTAKALTEGIELPLLWSEQEHAVGIN